MKTLIIVPAYNEEVSVVSVVESIKVENPMWDIIAINDGSTDKTGELAESTQKAFVIHLPCNLGIGGAVQTGFKFANERKYDIAVQFDGDGQHIASEIPKLLEPIEKGLADVVIGSRFCLKSNNFKSSISRRIGIRIFQVLNSVLIRQKITDNTSGFRAYNRRAIEFLAGNYPIDYPEPEAIILLGKNDFRIKEVFARMQDRQGGSSSISRGRAVYYMMKVILAVIMNFMRPAIVKK